MVPHVEVPQPTGAPPPEDRTSDAFAAPALVEEDGGARVTPAVEFRHVHLSFDEKKVLDDLSFTARKGEIKIILSGSGAASPPSSN